MNTHMATLASESTLRGAVLVEEFLKKISHADVGFNQVPPSRIAIEETINFLRLLSLGHSCSTRLISPEIDQVWHRMILDTRFYASLCASLPGRTFIHHEPGQQASTPSDEEISQCFAAISEYIHLTGGFNEESVVYWPGVKELADVFGLSLQEFNVRVAKVPRPSRVETPHFDVRPIRMATFIGSPV